MPSFSVLSSRAFAAALFVLSLQQIDAQEDASQKQIEMKIGGVEVSTILEKLGAKLEHGISADEMRAYHSHFALVDSDDDGRHSKVEYIENGNYLTPQARRGIFNAADSNKDGFVSKAEYVLNRIITDEGKALLQAMDEDKDGVVHRDEFTKHAEPKLSDTELTSKVFSSLDTDANKEIVIPEYLRVWGQWARADGKTPEQRLAAAKYKQARSDPSSSGWVSGVAEVRELDQLNQKLTQAYEQEDVNTLRSLLSDAHIHNNVFGMQLTKDAFLKDIESGVLEFVSYTTPSIEWYQDGNLAIATGVIEAVAKRSGKMVPATRFRFTRIFKREAGGFKVLLFQNTMVP